MIFDDLSFLENLPLEQYKFQDSVAIPKNCHQYRSHMMLNPLNLNHMNKIDENLADSITLNLEDAIALSRKKEALYNIALFLSGMKKRESFIVVRVNPLEQGGDSEIEFLNDFYPDAIRIPKVKSAHEVEQALGILAPNRELHISLETKEAFSDIKSLKIDERVTTANLGILDLLASLHLPQSLVKIDNPTTNYILSKFLVECKTSSIKPVSFMFQDYNDTYAFKKWCLYEREMGFESKACMGPKQVSIANSIFGYNETETKRAMEIKELFEANSKNHIHGFMSEKYGFIDEPIYKDALNILI